MTEPTSNAGAAALLQSTELFSEARSETITRVLASGFSRSTKKGEVLYRQGELGDTFFLIVTGTVRIGVDSPQGKTLNLRTFTQGDVMGEIALIDRGIRTATATVIEAGMVFGLAHSEFLAILKEDWDFAQHVLRLLCKRVRWTSSQLEDSAFLSTEGRVAKCLLALADSEGAIRASQGELAEYVSLARQSLNQILKRFEEDGLIDLAHRSIHIRVAEELVRLSVRE